MKRILSLILVFGFVCPSMYAAPGPDQKRILAVMVPQKERTWFIKMLGPATVVAEQEKAFKKFAESVKLPGGR